MHASIEDTIAQTTSKVNRSSSPSELKITDMRVAVVGNVGRTAIIRIDTNQGIYGLGEVRDGADERYALMLKSRILGLNPCNVEMISKLSGSMVITAVRRRCLCCGNGSMGSVR
jgi:L-alanine-DL-glutamate epimerase-like enolase superfamily enzyme